MTNRGKKRDTIFEINERSNGDIELFVSLPPRDPRHTPSMRYTTADAIAHLAAQSIVHGECLEEARLNNNPPNTTLEGTWVFKKYQKPKAKAKATPRKKTTTKSTRAKAKTKTTKTEA